MGGCQEKLSVARAAVARRIIDTISIIKTSAGSCRSMKSTTSRKGNRSTVFLVALILAKVSRSCSAWVLGPRHATSPGHAAAKSNRASGIYSTLTNEVDPNLLLQKFRNGEAPLITIPDFLPPPIIKRLLFDAQDLERFNFGSVAGVGQTPSNILAGQRLDQTIRKNVRQIWLRSNGWSLTPLVGDLDARNMLINSVENLRHDLAVGFNGSASKNMIADGVIEGIQLLNPQMIELSYLSYYPGSFYKRHIDTFTSNNRSKRVVSFILYLGGDSTSSGDESSSWCLEKDGGALRIYGEEYAQYTNCPLISCHDIDSKGNAQLDEDLSMVDKGYSDVPPIPGTMVIFDSAKVPHAVMETRRSRRCIVGWLNAPVQN